MLTKTNRSFTEGPLFFKMIFFALPIMATGILQILYGMADNIIVGQFSGDLDALGAVGSTSTLNNLMVNAFLGLAAGSSVVIAKSYGAKQERTVSRAVHTAMTVAVACGILFMIIGLFVTRPALTAMGTKPELLEKAILYLRIICLGFPASAVYNFGAAILRSVGDSKTPLIILSSTGIMNVLMNLFFVLVCGMAVDGVALATIFSQYLSAIAVLAVLRSRQSECYSLSRKKYAFDPALFKTILRLGIPAGIQSAMFSISNILIVKSMNTFPSEVIKANTISSNLDALTYTVCNSFSVAAMTFAGQNYGAMKIDRIKKVVIFAIIQASAAGLIMGMTELIFVDKLAMLYIEPSDPARAQILAYVEEITTLMLSTYFLAGVMDSLSSVVKALGYSLAPMMISLSGICGLRILWLAFVFPLEPFHSPTGIMTCYPVTWIATAIALAVLFIFAWRKIKRMSNEKRAQESLT